MHLHTITYSSRQSAIEVARKHLGDDVVILHSFKARDGNKAILAVDNELTESVGIDDIETQQERSDRAEGSAANKELSINNQILALAKKLDALSERLDRYETPDIENVAVQESLFSNVLESEINNRSAASTHNPELDLHIGTAKPAVQSNAGTTSSFEANMRDVVANFEEDIGALINYATRKPGCLMTSNNAPNDISNECVVLGQKSSFEPLGVLAK